MLKGIVEKSTKQTYENSKKETQISQFGRLLINSEWLPNTKGGFIEPNRISLTDLPVGFEKDTQRAKSLSIVIGMKQPERERAIKIITGGDRDLKMLIDFYQSTSDDKRRKMSKINPEEAPV